MAILGLGEVLGGHIIGQLRDQIGNKTAIIIQLVITLAAIIVVLLFNRLN